MIQMDKRIRSLELEMKSASGDELETKLSEYSRLNHEFEMADGYSYQSEITGVLKGLDLYRDEFSNLSLLFQRPEDLHVSQGKPSAYQTGHPAPSDEPTNHLDMESIAWLRLIQKLQRCCDHRCSDRYWTVWHCIIELDMGALYCIFQQLFCLQ